jgi:molybdopterin synthase sulfur carrier subunit
MRLQLRYFASLRDAAGVETEVVDHAGDAVALYAAVSARHGYAMPRERVRLAVNGAVAPWDRVLAEGDEVVFLPPVSGG